MCLSRLRMTETCNSLFWALVAYFFLTVALGLVWVAIKVRVLFESVALPHASMLLRAALWMNDVHLLFSVLLALFLSCRRPGGC